MTDMLSQVSKIDVITASGTTNQIKTPVLDMDEDGGFTNVMFFAAASVTATGQYLGFRMGTASASAGLETATGDVTHTLANLYLDVHKPRFRYVQGLFTAASASSPHRAIGAIRYGARSVPTTQPAAMTGAQLYSPSTGGSTA